MALAFIRTVILYILIVISLRIMGKRQIGELQPSELVVTILISNLAALPIEDTSLPLIGGVIPILTLVCFEVFVSNISLISVTARKFISGLPKVIIKNGVIDQYVMHELRFSVDDLLEELRAKDVFDFSEVDYAIVETNGKISVYKKFPYQNTVHSDLGISDDNATPPFVVITDGVISQNGLALCNKTEKFVTSTIKREKIALKDILLMVCDNKGDYKIVPKQRNKGKSGK